MPGWGSFLGKIADWFPGRSESKQNEIDRLLRENEKLQSQNQLSVSDSIKFNSNLDRIKQLRTEIERIKT